MRSLKLAVPAVAALLLAACGGQTGTGTINVKLVDGPITGYTQINVDILKVEIAGDSGWITLGEPDKVFNLLGLTGGVTATLVNGKTIPAGHYTQMRLVLGSDNTLMLSDGTVVPLTVPSGMETGIKLIVNFDVAPGTTRDVMIDFVAAHSIQVVQAGASTQYILRPTITVVDNFLATGSISGKLVDTGGAALAGAEVMAETLDGSGMPTVARDTFTASDGTYTLDLLPAGGTFYVVSQPVVGSQSYGALASGGFTISSATPTFVYDATFTLVSATGTLSGTITPTATGDLVDLLQTLAPGGTGSATFVLRGQVPVVGTAETYGFLLVPPGSYSVRATRGTTVLTSAASTVTAGATTTVNFTFP